MTPDDTKGLSLQRPRRIHLVGVGGVGMSAIATVLAEMGHHVSGSDLKDSPVLARLASAGVEVHVGHAASNIASAEVVAISSAIGEGNPEVAAARDAGLAVLSRAEVLAAIAGTKRTIAVAGTHGKTTTTSMLAQVLIGGGLRPSFVIGGELNEVGASAAWDDGEWMVVEADESDGTFLHLPAEMALVTNIEADHLDHYGSFEALEAAFDAFAAKAASAICWVGSPVAAAVAARCGAMTVGPGGEGRDPRYLVERLGGGRDGSLFSIRRAGGPGGEVRLAVPGAHNVANAAMACAAAMEVGVGFDAIADALARFGGVARRFQFRAEVGGVRVVDDYAHLPGEVASALAAAAEGGWRRVVAVFQPHRYSRTELLAKDFAGSFRQADVVVVTDVYPAGEAPRPGITGRLVADAVRAAEPDKEVHYFPERAQLAESVASIAMPGDVCVLMGAGDVGMVAEELGRWLR